MANPHETPFPPSSHIAGEPGNWVVGVIDGPATAQRTVQAAHDAGYNEEDVLVFHGQEALDHAQARDDARNPLVKVAAAMARLITDPGTSEKEYLEEARQGHSIVNIRAATSAQVVQATQLLEGFSTRHVKHFGQWTVTDLKQ